MNLGSVLSLLGSVLGGNHLDKPKVILVAEGERLVLPVTPVDVSFTTAQDNKTVNITQLGEALLFGMPKLRTLSFSSFLPAKEYPFVVGDSRSPHELVELLGKWQRNKEPVRIIVTGTPINAAFGINSIDYSRHDHTGDLYYTLQAVEYIDLNTSMAGSIKPIDALTGLRDRPSDNVEPTTATLSNRNADVLDAAKKAYGNYKHYRRVIEGNNLQDLTINNLSKLRRLKV